MGVKFMNESTEQNYVEIYLCYIQGQWWKMLVNVTTFTMHGSTGAYVKCAPVWLQFVLITTQSDTYF